VNVLVRGLHGFGDGIHQRAIIRSMIKYSTYTLWLQTAYPCLYLDLIGERLKLVDIQSRLRCQAKNAIREQQYFSSPPPNILRIEISYDGVALHPGRTLVQGLAGKFNLPADDLDFSLPIQSEWRRETYPLTESWPEDKPWLIVRPLTERREWEGYCRARNPLTYAYQIIYEELRERYFTISIADLSPGKEWLVGPGPEADVYFNKGELTPEQVMTLFSVSDLIFSSPGFALPLALALDKRIICVFGGFECADAYTKSENFLAIEPITPCPCYNKEHKCNKTIDLMRALERIEEFIEHDHTSTRNRSPGLIAGISTSS
jgi:hypothetical protein